jgi:hypothetical protein
MTNSVVPMAKALIVSARRAMGMRGSGGFTKPAVWAFYLCRISPVRAQYS